MGHLGAWQKVKSFASLCNRVIWFVFAVSILKCDKYSKSFSLSWENVLKMRKVADWQDKLIKEYTYYEAEGVTILF